MTCRLSSPGQGVAGLPDVVLCGPNTAPENPCVFTGYPKRIKPEEHWRREGTGPAIRNMAALISPGIALVDGVLNLREHGMPESEALKAATRVLRYHHPSPGLEARNVVECWVFEHSRQAAN